MHTLILACLHCKEDAPEHCRAHHCGGCFCVWCCSEEEHPAPKCPKIDHVIMAMMENRPASLLMTNPDQVRNIQAMINRYSPATKYYGYTHPSEPNCKWRDQGLTTEGLKKQAAPHAQSLGKACHSAEALYASLA